MDIWNWYQEQLQWAKMKQVIDGLEELLKDEARENAQCQCKRDQ